MMKKIITICLGLILVLGMNSCESPRSAVRELESFLYELETNYLSYTEEDWRIAAETYIAIEEKLAQYEYTDEELKEIGRLKGRCIGMMAKKVTIDYKKKFDDITKEIEGAIEGFINVFSN